MKHFTHTLMMSVLIAGGLSLTSCKDDDFQVNGDYDDSRESELVAGARDLANGKGVIYIDVDEVPEKVLTLGTRKNVAFEIEDEENFPFNLELLRDNNGDNHLLLSSLKENVKEFEPGETRGFFVNLFTSDKSQSKLIRLTFRKKSATANTPERKEYYYEKIGKSMHPWSSYGATVATILDAQTAPLSFNYVLEDIYYDYGGERFEKTLDQFSTKVGLSFKGPNVKVKGKNFVLSGGVDVLVEGTEEKTNNAEYYVALNTKSMASVTLSILTPQPNRFDSIKHAMINADYLKTNENDPKAINVHDLLNDPDSKFYELYPNTKAGIYALFKDFGTHVICQGVFGGSYIKAYARYENAYENKIGVDVSANASAKQKTEGITDWVDIWKAKNSNYLNFDFDFGYYSDNYIKASKYISFEKGRGGSVVSTDYNTWDKSFSTSDPDGWVLISYIADENNRENTNNIVPLYEFIYETNRRDAVMAYFDSYIDDYATENFPDKPEWTLVLADIQFYAEKNGSHKVPSLGRSFVGFPIGADENHPAIYVPMMANRNFPIEDDWGYPVETCQNDFLKGAVDGAHYWYYALGYEELGTFGITDIRFLDAEQDKEFLESQRKKGYYWEPRTNLRDGKNTHSNTDITLSINNNMPYVLPADKYTHVMDKVKAFALCEKGDHGLYYGNSIFASTGGAEWQRNWGATDDVFKHYWANTGADKVMHPYAEDYFYENGSLNLATIHHQFYPVVHFDKLPVQTAPDYGYGDWEGKIQVPLKWLDPK